MDSVMRTVFIGIGIYLAIFIGIVALSIFAVRRSRQSITGFFWQAWIGVVHSGLGIITNMRVSYMVNGKGIDWNIKWIYLLPLLISCWALVNRFKVRRAPETVALPPAT
jgi:hypothetical protein